MYKLVWPTSVNSAKSIKFISFFILFFIFLSSIMFEALLHLHRAVCEANGHSQSIMERRRVHGGHTHMWWWGRDIDFIYLRSTMLNSIEVEAVEIEPVVEERPTGSVTSCHSHGICKHLVADVSFHKEWLRARNSCSWCIHGSFKKMGTTFFASDWFAVNFPASCWRRSNSWCISW